MFWPRQTGEVMAPLVLGQHALGIEFPGRCRRCPGLACWAPSGRFVGWPGVAACDLGLCYPRNTKHSTFLTRETNLTPKRPQRARSHARRHSSILPQEPQASRKRQHRHKDGTADPFDNQQSSVDNWKSSACRAHSERWPSMRQMSVFWESGSRSATSMHRSINN